MSDPTPHVLLVVDAEEDRRSLHDILAGEGYRLTDAKGADALEVARDLEPCVTLVDGAGAAEVLAKLKSDPGTRDLAVIVLSAAEDAAGLLGDPRRGAADHIAKPFLPAEVIARVRSQVTIRRLERDLERRNEQLERTNRQMRSDLEAAAEVQRSLLPRVAPDVPGVGFAWHYRPCLALAGDSLGVLPLDDRHVALYVLDVSGHGVSSALLSVAVTRSLGLKSDPAALVSVREPGEEEPRVRHPAEVASRLNDLFPMDAIDNHYFTLTYGILDPETGRFEFVSPGNPGPILARPGEAPRVYDRPAVPIGMFPDSDYEDATIQMAPGDRVYLHSDGLTEERNGAGEEFGRERLLAAIAAAEALPLEKAVDAVAQASRDWRGADACRDDVALLGFEYRGS